VDVDHSALEIIRNEQVLQVAPHDYQLGIAIADQMKHRISMLDRVTKVLFAEDMGGDSSISGDFNASDFRAAADDRTKLDLQPLLPLMEQKVFQGRSPTGD
jgi:hypothetical protein